MAARRSGRLTGASDIDAKKAARRRLKVSPMRAFIRPTPIAQRQWTISGRHSSGFSISLVHRFSRCRQAIYSSPADRTQGCALEQISEDREIVDRKSVRRGITRFFLIVVALLSESNLEATFIIRHRTTGEVKRVTARSLDEAAIMIAKGWFDPEQCPPITRSCSPCPS